VGRVAMVMMGARVMMMVVIMIMTVVVIVMIMVIVVVMVMPVRVRLVLQSDGPPGLEVDNRHAAPIPASAIAAHQLSSSSMVLTFNSSPCTRVMRRDPHGQRVNRVGIGNSLPQAAHWPRPSIS
jgi:hypothetical protein